MKPIIILGAYGQLGKCVQDELALRQLSATALSSKDCNIGNITSVNEALNTGEPAIIVNCAAYTAVDKAEDDIENARLINADGAHNIAKACHDNNHQLIHISTDYVFDGSAETPYTTDIPTSPLGVYGETKLEGEQKVSEALSSAVIIRTSWVFSEYGNNFVKTMLRLAQDRNELNVVADQKGKPTYARDLARAICSIIEQAQDSKLHGGLYHFSNEGETNWCEFAQAIFTQGKELGLLGHEMQVNAIGSADYPTRAKRPMYSVLDNSKIYEDFSLQAKDWQASLNEMLGKLKEQVND